MQSRRSFLGAAAAASTAFGLFTISGTKASGRVLGANDTVRIGVAGINGRGGEHISQFTGLPNVQVAYLIDPDTRLFESRTKAVTSKGQPKPTCVQDIRKALDDKSLDAVSVATCNHWHSLITVWACQAEKDVYVEKPISHNIFEGRQCVEAAKKYKRVVQHGTQRRSSQGDANTISAVRSEKYGKLLVSKGYCCKPRWSIGTKKTGAPPSGLDFNLWLGPAAEQPYHGNLVHYNWHWFWETGNGDIGNQGVHEMDVARWAIAGGTLPSKVWTLGGRFLPNEKDQGETPNMQISAMQFGDVTLLFETRGLVGKDDAPKAKVENEFYTTDGVIRGGKFYPSKGGDAVDIKGKGDIKVSPGGAFGSFVNAVRSRKMDEVNCDAEVAHYSAALCHLANISYRLGKPAKFDKKTNSLGDNKQVVESFAALQDNLQAAKVSLDTATYTLGRELTFDPKAEKFVGDEQANQLLSRPYRAPFVVPEKV